MDKKPSKWKIINRRLNKKRGYGAFKFKNSRHAAAYIKGVFFHQLENKDYSVYNKMNKLYKEVDFRKNYIRYSDARDILKDNNKYFYNINTLQKRDLIHTYTPTNRALETYVFLDELEQEMLRREMCAYKDDMITAKEAQTKTKKKRREYEKSREQIIVKINGEERIMGWYLSRKMKDVEKAIKLLYKYKNIFIEGNDPYVSPFHMYKFFKILVSNGEDINKINKWIEKHKL